MKFSGKHQKFRSFIQMHDDRIFQDKSHYSRLKRLTSDWPVKASVSTDYEIFMTTGVDMKRYNGKLALVAGVYLGLNVVTAQAATYSIIDLTLGGTDGEAFDINNNGQVIGVSSTPTSGYHGFLYSNGTITDLKTSSGINYSPYGINNNGQTTGSAGNAFMYNGVNMIDLGSFGSIYGAAGQAVNDNGNVAGAAYIGNSGSIKHAFLYSNGVMTDLGTLGGSSSVAWDINNSNKIVGESDIYGNLDTHAFLYDNGVKTDLGTLGGSNSIAYSINNNDQVVGQSFTVGNSHTHAFLYSNGVMTDLGSLGSPYANEFSTANDINNNGQVVGSTYTAKGDSVAFLYSNGVMTDLNTLISTAGWTLTSAIAINDNGEIVVNGYNALGQSHALLLTSAVPIPGAAWLFATSLFGLAGLNRRKQTAAKA